MHEAPQWHTEARNHEQTMEIGIPDCKLNRGSDSYTVQESAAHARAAIHSEIIQSQAKGGMYKQQ